MTRGVLVLKRKIENGNFIGKFSSEMALAAIALEMVLCKLAYLPLLVLLHMNRVSVDTFCLGPEKKKTYLCQQKSPHI